MSNSRVAVPKVILGTLRHLSSTLVVTFDRQDIITNVNELGWHYHVQNVAGPPKI